MTTAEQKLKQLLGELQFQAVMQAQQIETLQSELIPLKAEAEKKVAKKSSKKTGASKAPRPKK